MLGILISAAILCGIMWVVARREAEIDFKIVLLICLGVTLLGLFTQKPLGLYSIPITFGALAWALQRFCYLSWPKSIIVTVLYILVSVGLSLAIRG